MKTLPFIFLFSVVGITAQEQKQDKFLELEKEVAQQKEQINLLQNKIKQQERIVFSHHKELNNFKQNASTKIDSLQNSIKYNSENIQAIASDLGTKIQQTESSTKDSISKLDENVNQNKIYWLIGLLVTIGLGGIVYWLLGKKIKNSKTDIESQIRETQKNLEEEAIKLDSKLVEVLETQLKLKQEEKIQTPTNNTNEIDHSLALKVADEIIRIQKNIAQMDEETKGLKQLSASVKRIQDNFASNGYELVEMLGKEYNEGMKVVANFIPNEDLETGKQIITRIIKPQVNYKGEMIQSAQIEVSVGE